MKKFITIILTLALVLSLSVPVFAAENPTEAKTELWFTYTVPEPVYTVTIPATINLKLNEGGHLDVTVSDIENIGNKKISITLEDALTGRPDFFSSSPIHDYFVLRNKDVSENSTLYDGYYRDIGYIIWTPSNGGLNYLPNYDWELMQFAENETKQLGFGILPYNGDDELDVSKLLPNSPYTGYIVFGIKLV